MRSLKKIKTQIPARNVKLYTKNKKDDFICLKKPASLRCKIIFSPTLRLYILAGFFSLMMSASCLSTAYATTQVGRYSTISNKPTPAQVNPLLAVAQYKFSPKVKTIGDAIGVILQTTSYQLAPASKLSIPIKSTLTKSLPITVRTLGPIQIKDALVILMGRDVFTLVVDPLHRLINFKVKPRIAKALGVHHA